MKDKNAFEGFKAFSSKMTYGDTGMNIMRIVCGYLLHQQVVVECVEGK
jgi:hypothetical protein